MSQPLRSDRPGTGHVSCFVLAQESTDVTPNTTPIDEERNARLVRNLLALRMVLAMDQMQTGRWSDRIEELDEELANLGHDMKSTAASAADGLRRTALLPRLVKRRVRSNHRAATRAGSRN
jgi:hypothetical protein